MASIDEVVKTDVSILKLTIDKKPYVEYSVDCCWTVRGGMNVSQGPIRCRKDVLSSNLKGERGKEGLMCDCQVIVMLCCTCTRQERSITLASEKVRRNQPPPLLRGT